jgi:hypothetical protein
VSVDCRNAKQKSARIGEQFARHRFSEKFRHKQKREFFGDNWRQIFFAFLRNVDFLKKSTMRKIANVHRVKTHF